MYRGETNLFYIICTLLSLFENCSKYWQPGLFTGKGTLGLSSIVCFDGVGLIISLWLLPHHVYVLAFHDREG
jgi:hypothetical protein